MFSWECLLNDKLRKGLNSNLFPSISNNFIKERMFVRSIEGTGEEVVGSEY